MTDPTATETHRHDLEESPAPDRRPIPDGGLGSSMPEWMRQTPSWKRDSEPAVVRSVPDADTSVIDPSELIDIDDLPQWLQAIASRVAGPVEAPAPADAIGDPPILPARASDDVTAAPGPAAAERPRPGPGTWLPRPATEAPVEQPDHVRLTRSPSDPVPPWWMSDAVIAFLFVAIILTLIYVILAAIGVF